jgi:hypothetical protein
MPALKPKFARVVPAGLRTRLGSRACKGRHCFRREQDRSRPSWIGWDGLCYDTFRPLCSGCVGESPIVGPSTPGGPGSPILRTCSGRNHSRKKVPHTSTGQHRNEDAVKAFLAQRTEGVFCIGCGFDLARLISKACKNCPELSLWVRVRLDYQNLHVGPSSIQRNSMSSGLNCRRTRMDNGEVNPLRL